MTEIQLHHLAKETDSLYSYELSAMFAIIRELCRELIGQKVILFVGDETAFAALT